MAAESFLPLTIEEVINRLRSAMVPLAVKDRLARLANQLKDIEGGIPSAEQQRDQNLEAELWFAWVEDLVDDLDDLVDELSTEAQRRCRAVLPDKIISKVCNFFPSFSDCLLMHCYKLGINIGEVEESHERVAKLKSQLHLRDPSTGVTETETGLSTGDEVIGRKLEKEEILRRLFDRRCNPPVIKQKEWERFQLELPIQQKEGLDDRIAIVGNKGVGKTTLAKLVYNDARVVGHFESRFWLSVSGTGFNLKLKLIEGNCVESVEEIGPCSTDDARKEMEKVRRKLYRTDDAQKAMEKVREKLYSEMAERLKEKTQGRNCLLVVDNLTLADQHLVLLLRLECKILLTTRYSGLCSILWLEYPRFTLRGLSEKEAWSLFKKMAFKQGEKHNGSNKIDKGKKIVRKCRGIPLAIKQVGSFLGSKVSEKEWQEFMNDDFPKIIAPYSWVSSDFRPLTTKKSFNYLASNHKRCFAYCGLFSGHEFHVQTLIALWMAQGFIKSSDGETLEDVGIKCFERLKEYVSFQAESIDEQEVEFERTFSRALNWRLSQSKSEDNQIDELGNYRSCSLIRLDHELAMYAAQGKIILMDPYGDNMHERVRHVTLDFNVDSSWQIPIPLLKAYRLRTLLLSPQSRLPNEEKLSTSTCDTIFSTFKRLRVLDLHDFGMKMIPDSLGKLKHLRYLDLSNNSFAMLPTSTTTLLNLQTLKLSDCHKMKELPQGINNLISLRHIIIDGCLALTHMPHGLTQLGSLQTLSTFVLSVNDNLEELKLLNNLRGSLEILHLERVMTRGHVILGQKQHLQCVTLKWNRDDGDNGEGDNHGDHDDNEELEVLDQPHTNLKMLDIVGFNGKNLPRWVSNLSSLVKLSLHDLPRCQFLPPLHKLPSLKILEVARLEDLEFIAKFEEFSSPSPSTTAFFPSLKEITLWDCPDLISWWNRTDELPSKPIQRLEIQYCPKLTSIPFYPQELGLECHVDQLQKLMKVAQPSSSLSHQPSSSNADSWKLKSLSLKKIEGLQSIPELLINFTSLQRLHIQDCHKLTSLSKGIQHLPSLKDLIVEKMEPNLFNDDDKEMLGKLLSLTIKGIPKLKDLPEPLKHATKLEKLELCSCPSLMSLPEWIGNLKSLHKLIIEYCPFLRTRCQRQTGEDWPQIAHIGYKKYEQILL